MKSVHIGVPLRYVVRQPSQENYESAPLIIFLHNKASDMHAFLGLADAIATDHFTYLFPNAPFPISTAGHREPAR